MKSTFLKLALLTSITAVSASVFAADGKVVSGKNSDPTVQNPMNPEAGASSNPTPNAMSEQSEPKGKPDTTKSLGTDATKTNPKLENQPSTQSREEVKQANKPGKRDKRAANHDATKPYSSMENSEMNKR